MPDKVFTAENCKVHIYLDTGAGAPSGSALFTMNYVRATAPSLTKSYELIPHLGYSYEEPAIGTTRYTLNLEKNVEDGDRDLRLTDALYYIRIEVWTDDRNGWIYYNCKKCRRVSWDFPRGDTGLIVCRASFIVEDFSQEDV